MVSKGIVVYSYISVEGYEVEFGVPGDRTVNTSADNHSAKDLEIESSKIPGLEHFTGRFIWRVLKNSLEIANRYNDINSLTGNLVGGNMKTTMENQSIFIGDIIISFGFYDAGTGRVGLTSKDQCYVTVTRNQSTWMGNLAPQGSTAASKPFSRFVMVAPHDDGMDTMQNSDAVINGLDVDSLVPLVKNVPELQWFDDLIPSEMLVHMLPNIVEALAVTQKDTTASMLALGARYFEFRPAFLVPVFQEISRLDNKLYFQHACIPGLAFDVFLDQVIAFLDTHVAEIVTIHLRWDNVISECRHPTMDELNAAIKQSLAKSNGFIKCGGIDCLTQPIDTLRANGTRLICIVEAQKYDSWTAAAYATLTAAPILERFESMNTEGQEAYPLTVLQCQATSQSIKEVLVYSAVAANASNSCLTETKAMLDQQTLPWIRDNLLQRLTAEKPVVVMNDFIDGATVDIAIGLSKARLDLGKAHESHILTNSRRLAAEHGPAWLGTSKHWPAGRFLTTKNAKGSCPSVGGVVSRPSSGHLHSAWVASIWRTLCNLLIRSLQSHSCSLSIARHHQVPASLIVTGRPGAESRQRPRTNPTRHQEHFERYFDTDDNLSATVHSPTAVAPFPAPHNVSAPRTTIFSTVLRRIIRRTAHQAGDVLRDALMTNVALPFYGLPSPTVSHDRSDQRSLAIRRAPSVASRSTTTRRHRSNRSHHGGSSYAPQNEFPNFAHTGDVEIIISAGGQEKRYMLHRLILARSSGFFEAGTSEEWTQVQALARGSALAQGQDRGLGRIREEDEGSLIGRGSTSVGAGQRSLWRYELDPETVNDEAPLLTQKPLSATLFGGEQTPGPPPVRNKPPPPSNGFFRSISAMQSAINIPQGSSHSTDNEVIQDYDNLFRIFYNYPPTLDGIDITEAYIQCKRLLNLADMYDALEVVGPRIDHHLLQFQSRLWKQIAKYPPSYLKLGYLARSKVIFAEALVHVVGQWPLGAPQLQNIPDLILELIEDKVDELQDLKAKIEGRLFRLTLVTHRGERVSPWNAPHMQWMVICLFRQWLAENTTPPPPPIPKTSSSADRQSQPPPPTPLNNGRIYRLLGTGGPSYLGHDELKRFMKLRPDEYSRDNLKKVERWMEEMKALARETVKPLMRNFLELDLGQNGGGMGYLTCTRMDEADFPWD